MHGGSAASCCARWPSSGQPAECRGIGLRNTRGPYAVSCREGSGSPLPSRTYIPRARDGSCSISSTVTLRRLTAPLSGRLPSPVRCSRLLDVSQPKAQDNQRNADEGDYSRNVQELTLRFAKTGAARLKHKALCHATQGGHSV